MTTTLEKSICIEAETAYLAEQSDPAVQRYVFAYTITIHNAGDRAARLLTRRWLITDANGKTSEVLGDGVIGEQPYLPPGEKHTYSSGAVIKTPVGTMQGSYGMQAEDGMHFDAAIPVLSLAVPRILN